jgi:hypothetical protein
MLQVGRKGDQTRRTVPAVHPAKPAVMALGVSTLVCVVVSPSPLAVLASGIVSIVMLILLWRQGTPPILLVPVFAQFAAVGLKPVMTAFTNRSLQDLADFSANLEPAAFFGLAGLTALVAGLRIGGGDLPARARQAAIENWPYRQILTLALAAIIIGHALDFIAERFDGARQIMLALGGVKWAGLFVLGYGTLRLRRGLRWLAAIVSIEIVLGMSGFFGEFRLVLFVLLAAAIGAQNSLRRRGMVALGVGAGLTLLLTVFWSAVKTDYRAFLNQGTRAQVVLQPLDERLSFLAHQAAEFNGQKFTSGFEMLLERVSYIDFLAATMERVPAVVPHEGGARLGAAIWHIVTPRILFPDKPELPSDTLLTAYYTGLPSFIWADANTSISIGYLGELYIDFGVGGALLAVFLMSLVFGRCYRAIRDYPGMPVFVNYGLCMMVAIQFGSFETALIKLVGGLITILAGAVAVQRLLWPVLISFGWITMGGSSVRREKEA